jgi:hypothetical protein
MATISTGIEVKFGEVAFTEVYELGLPLYGGVRKDRSTDPNSSGWSDEVGDVSVSAYGATNMSLALYGTRNTFIVAGGGISLTFNAVCTGVSATPQLNGVTRYTFTAKLLDT